jgi:pimeloyl-ACP methyl ester carboxylesterase
MNSEPTPPTPTLLDITDKLSIRYEKIGSEPPLLLLHTIRTQLEYFRYLAPLLAGSYTVYAVDLPGHGQSPIDPTARFDEPYLREAITAFIKRLDLKDLTLVGESIGAVLALTVASELPGRVKAVFALNPYDYETRYGDGIRRGNLFANVIVGCLQIPVLGAAFAHLENRAILGTIMGGGYYDAHNLPPNLLTLFDRTSRRPRYRSMQGKMLSAWRSWPVARSRYAHVEAPVTLVYGAKDWSRVGERQRTREALPGSRFVTLEKTGHFSAVEKPREIANIILGVRS